jgi:hypothetical protein
MPGLCWDCLRGTDCAYCRYKQARYREGFSVPCYAWFAARRVEKKCRECRFYREERSRNPDLPEDPSWHP